jgi:hypothetical protein
MLRTNRLQFEVSTQRRWVRIGLEFRPQNPFQYQQREKEPKEKLMWVDHKTKQKSSSPFSKAESMYFLCSTPLVKDAG